MRAHIMNIATFCLVGWSSLVAMAVAPTGPEIPVTGEASGPALSLRKAVDSALHDNPSFIETLRQADQVSFEVPVAKANLFPVVNWTNSALEKKDATTNPAAYNQGGAYNYYQSSLTLAQPLFFYGSLDAIRNAEKDHRIAKVSSEITARNLIGQVVQTFYQIVLDTRVYGSLVRQEKIVHASLETATRRARTGRGQLLDELQTKTQIALLKSQISTSKNQVQIDAANLATLMGHPQEPKISIPDKLEFPSLKSVAEFTGKSKPRVLELDKSAILISQIEDQKSITWGKNLPNLQLTGAYNFNGYKAADWFDSSSNNWNVGLLLTIPIFSGFSTNYQIDALNAQRAYLEMDRENIKNTVNYQEVSAYKQLETAEVAIIQGEEALKLAKASSEEATRNYRLATIDFLQFLTVQQALVQAEQTLDGYRYNYLVALLAFSSAAGLDMNNVVDFLEHNGEVK